MLLKQFRFDHSVNCYILALSVSVAAWIMVVKSDLQAFWDSSYIHIKTCDVAERLWEHKVMTADFR